MTIHKTGTREDWLAARLALLKEEKELTRRGVPIVYATGYSDALADLPKAPVVRKPFAPEMALVESAKILRKHLNPFVQYTELGPQVRSPARETSVRIWPWLRCPPPSTSARWRAGSTAK